MICMSGTQLAEKLSAAFQDMHQQEAGTGAGTQTWMFYYRILSDQVAV